MIRSGRDLTKRFEGLTLTAKADAQGRWVVGRGHDIPPSPGLTWTLEQADAQFEADYIAATIHATVVVTGEVWKRLNEPRRAVLTDMVFEMGAGGVAGFHDMLTAIHAEDWREAARQGLDSKWHKEQAPARAETDMEILLTGEWPEEDQTEKRTPIMDQQTSSSITLAGTMTAANLAPVIDWVMNGCHVPAPSNVTLTIAAALITGAHAAYNLFRSRSAGNRDAT